MRALYSQLLEWKLLLSPCLQCFTGVRLLSLDLTVKWWVLYFMPIHFMKWSTRLSFPLSVAHRVFETSCSNYLPPLCEGFLNGPLLWVLWCTAQAPYVTNTLVIILMYTDGFKPPVLEGSYFAWYTYQQCSATKWCPSTWNLDQTLHWFTQSRLKFTVKQSK